MISHACSNRRILFVSICTARLHVLFKQIARRFADRNRFRGFANVLSPEFWLSMIAVPP